MRFFAFKRWIIVNLLLFITIPHCSLLSAGNNKQSDIESPDQIFIFFPNLMLGLTSGNYKWTSSDDSITIPLRQAGRIFLIEANVDGETGYLVFDSGASGVVLNKTYFRNHVIIDSQNSSGVNGKVNNVERVNIDHLEFTGLQYVNIVADITNLGHIENRRGVKILGLIGLNLLKDFEIIFDPAQNQLQLFQIDKKGERVNHSTEKFESDFTTSFEQKNSVIFIDAIMKGKSLRFCFDTGAETNVIDRYAPKGVINCITITRRSTLRGAGSGSTEVLFGTMNDFLIGQNNLSNLETIITNLDPLSDAYGTKIDGMLGYSFISKGVVCINFLKKELGINYYKTNEQ